MTSEFAAANGGREPMERGINPSITDSTTFTFDSPEQMHRLIEGELEGLSIYSRHLNPTVVRLARSLARLERTEDAVVTSSGMAAISSAVLSLCREGDEVVASRTVYGGTYSLLANFLPRLGVRTRFVDMDRPEEVVSALSERTRLLYCETLSNPLLEVADLPTLAGLARERGIPLVVDNTFAPLLVRPRDHGAAVVVHSLTKYANGMADGLGGAVCGDAELTAGLLDLEAGPCLVLGCVLDAHRAASIGKNLQTLHLRMRQHGANALAVAAALEGEGLRVHYPGLPSHPHHERFLSLAAVEVGFGGVLSVDFGSFERASMFTAGLQRTGAAAVAVSLGCPRTLVTVPGTSTAAEMPEEAKEVAGIAPGLVRIAVGIEADPEALAARFVEALAGVGLQRANA